jgi:hypothetical protein
MGIKTWEKELNNINENETPLSSEWAAYKGWS